MSGMLAGLRVVEVAEGVAGPYCGRLLADLGAEVIKVERPAVGDPCRSVAPFDRDARSPDSGLLFNYLNANKLGVALDLTDAKDRAAFGGLLVHADALVSSGPVAAIEQVGITFSALSVAHPQLVCTYLTPFGLEGERAHWKAGELVAFHMSGLGLLTPSENAKPMRPPLKAGGHQALMVAGLTAAVATLHALFARAATGQGQRVDIAEVDPLTSFQFMNVGRWTYAGDPGRRGFKEGNRRVWCRDGAVSLLVSQDHQWRALVEVMGHPEWADAPEYATRAGRAAHGDALWARIQAWAADHPKEAIYRTGQQRRVPVFPENSIAEAIESAQVRSRGFIRPMPLASGGSVGAPSRPFTSSRFPVERPRPAPKVGEHQAQVLSSAACGRDSTRPKLEVDARGGLPLAGVTITDFSWVLAGPRATSWLAAMGARVIKVEGPRRPDQYRNVAIFMPGHEGIEGSAAFHGLNHSKFGVAIDFTTPKGLDLIKRLIAKSDVVVENFAHGVMKRVGLSYEELCKLRPDMIMASLTALGGSGPDKGHVAYGTLIHSFSGLNSVTGYPETPMGSMGGTYTDPLTGTTAVLAILAALWHRRRTGEGRFLDFSMAEATLMQLPEFVLDYTANGRLSAPHGNEDGIAAPHNCYPCAGDDSWVAIAVSTQAEWDALCAVLGNPAWTRDPRFQEQEGRYQHREALDAQIAAWTRTRTPMQVTAMLQAAGVAAGPSYAGREIYEDAYFHQRGLFHEVEHPVIGRKPVVGLPWRLEPGPSSRYHAAPTLGQHTDRVLCEVLGLDNAEIAALRAEQIIA